MATYLCSNFPLRRPPFAKYLLDRLPSGIIIAKFPLQTTSPVSVHILSFIPPTFLSLSHTTHNLQTGLRLFKLLEVFLLLKPLTQKHSWLRTQPMSYLTGMCTQNVYIPRKTPPYLSEKGLHANKDDKVKYFFKVSLVSQIVQNDH